MNRANLFLDPKLLIVKLSVLMNRANLFLDPQLQVVQLSVRMNRANLFLDPQLLSVKLSVLMNRANLFLDTKLHIDFKNLKKTTLTLKLLLKNGYKDSFHLQIVSLNKMESLKAISRKKKRRYDYHLYKQTHLVENTFLYLKRQKSISTRSAKNIISFIAIVQIRCLFLWLNII